MNTTSAEGSVDATELDENAPDEPDELSLAAGFPAAGRDEWVALVDKVVRRSGRIGDGAEPGAGVEKLTRTTPDGIRVRPLYTADDRPDGGTDGEAGVPGRAPFVRGSRAAGVVPDGWDVRQRHAEPDPDAAREAVTADLENGVNSVWLAVGEGGTAVADLPAVLADVHLHMAPVVLDAGGGATAEEAAEAFLALAADREVPAADLLGTLGLDPVGHRARTGGGPDVESVVPLALRAGGGVPAGPGDRRRRAPGARRGRFGRPGAGLVPRRRGGLPAGPDGRGPGDRRRGPAAGVPLRRHRRAVPDRGEVPRRAAAVGPGDAGVRVRAAPAAARGRLAGDAHPA